MAKRSVPEINAGSMADIAFLLLIFFLVTTTMDVDKGLNRKLPPWDDNPVKETSTIKEKNVFVVLVNGQDQLLVEDEYMDVRDLRQAAKEFIDNNGDGSCDVCKGSRSPESSDNPAKAIISLQNDRGTSYETYIKVQNELVAAYNDLRDELAQSQFGKPFDLLGEDAKKFVQDKYPQIISEAEPVSLGGR
jgi:biopolymer transport protein ExbD